MNEMEKRTKRKRRKKVRKKVEKEKVTLQCISITKNTKKLTT